MIFSACINLPASSHYKGMYPHGSPILWYIPVPLSAETLRVGILLLQFKRLNKLFRCREWVASKVDTNPYRVHSFCTHSNVIYTWTNLRNLRKNEFHLYFSMNYRDFSVKSNLIISLFQTVKLSLSISLFQKIGFS